MRTQRLPILSMSHSTMPSLRTIMLSCGSAIAISWQYMVLAGTFVRSRIQVAITTLMCERPCCLRVTSQATLNSCLPASGYSAALESPLPILSMWSELQGAQQVSFQQELAILPKHIIWSFIKIQTLIVIHKAPHTNALHRKYSIDRCFGESQIQSNSNRKMIALFKYST